MDQTTATLHMICGKIAAGKSTLAARLGAAKDTIMISEDKWLAALFADQMHTGADYVRCAAQLRDAMGPHVADLMSCGISVVLDYPANTPETRAWMRSILDGTKAKHQMHVLDVPDDVCLARLKKRNATGAHEFAVTEAQYRQFTKHYVPPTAEEGFKLVIHPFRGS